MRIAGSPTGKNLMTAEEFLALPEDGKERWLINGELRPRDPATSLRSPLHGAVEASVVFQLMRWLKKRSEPRGRVSCGGVGFLLHREPDTFVGLDVAYTLDEIRPPRTKGSRFYEVPPVLAVEILSGADEHGDIVERVHMFLKVGTVVWVIDPDFRTVTVHRAGQALEAFNTDHELAGEPYLPGFRVPVRRLFEG